MRCVVALPVLLFGVVPLAACGNDFDPESTVDAGVTIAPDGKIIVPDPEDGGVPGDGSITEPDAMVMLTDCEEATLHSDLAWLQQKVFTPSCATAGCHASGMSLAAGQTHASLVNRASSIASGWTRVVPGSVATSYLVVALGRGTGPTPPSGTMPLGALPLCVEKLEAIERWIAAGAQP